MIALDLFACAGGSTTGLERAGFDVIGIDHKPSQHWCGAGALHQANLSTAEDVEAVIRAFAPDFVSASPPCQKFSSATPTRNRGDHPDLIGSTRAGIEAAGVPGFIENVSGAPLHHSLRLCGSMFPETQRLRRHRFFELLGWWTLEPEHRYCTFLRDEERRERQRRPVTSVMGEGAGSNTRKRNRRLAMTIAGNAGHGPGQIPGQNNAGKDAIRWREAMGWLDGPKHRYSLAQAVPPAYAAWLGSRFMAGRARR